MLRRAPGVQVQPSLSQLRASSQSHVQVRDDFTDQTHRVRFERSDIDVGIRFSYWRCVVSIIGFALVLTDIPRTGLCLTLGSLYKSAAPGVYWSYGPYAYSTIHINRTAGSDATGPTYKGFKKGKPIATATVWAYKFDTLSISQRAIAEHLQLNSYPACILYRLTCPELTLNLSTTFGMIDGWISGMQARYFALNGSDGELPFVFMTRSNWLDRLHHILVKLVWKRHDTRLHTVRYHSADAINSSIHPWSICGVPTFPRNRRMYGTMATLSRIPSHVVVYGSWLPVACYSIAHVIDSGLTHLISNNVWASTDGLFKFQFMSYIQSASVQMRNVWMIAFVWKLLLFAYTYNHSKSIGEAWAPRNGILAMRGIFISFISWLTVFSFLRALRFRDTDIVLFTPLPRHTPMNGLRFPPNYSNIADFGYRLDVKTAILATLLVVIFGQLLQHVVSFSTRRQTRFFFCRTYYIPHSADRLWPRAMLHLFWNLGLNEVSNRVEELPSQSRYASMTTNAIKVLEHAILPPTPKTHVNCSVCNRPQSFIHWRGVQGCVRHDLLFRVEVRQAEVWAMVRLVNIAFLSDPITLFKVYLFGYNLYLYTARADLVTSPDLPPGPEASSAIAYLLPASLEDIGEMRSGRRLSLLTTVNSKSLAWSSLVNCG